MNDQYAELYSSYQWLVPSQFNISQACVHRWAENPLDGRRIAIFHENELGAREVWTYARVSDTANQLANGLLKMGVQRGDRVAVIMSQRPEYVVAFMAILAIGAVAVPLPTFSDAAYLSACLRDATPRVAVVDDITGRSVLDGQNKYPFLDQIIGLDFPHEATIPWRTLLARQASVLKTAPTPSHAPAILLYEPQKSPGPRGTLLAHRSLIGNLPGFVAAQNWFPQSNDIFWTPREWHHGDGLMSALLPTLYFGRPIVNSTGRFSADEAIDLMTRYRVTNSYMTPDQLKTMMLISSSAPGRNQLKLRALSSSGGLLGRETFTWCERSLGVTPNLFYSQVQTGAIIGNSHHKWSAKPESMGRPYPGHRVALLDKHGTPCPVGAVGEIVVSQNDIHGDIDPALFLGYWQKGQDPVSRSDERWQQTGDLALIDEDGYYWYQGRKDA